MIPTNRVATHPGQILKKEFLDPLEISQRLLADHLQIPIQRINQIVNGKRGITPDTAWLLSEALSTTPQFWLNLQTNYDLSSKKPEKHVSPLQAVGM
jgi:addiction module HigA family antidote